MAVPLHIVWTSELSASDRVDYEELVTRARGGHFAQLPAWDEVTRSIRPLSTRYLLVRRPEDQRLIGCARLTRPTVMGIPLPVATVERGPVVDDLSHLATLLANLRYGAPRGIARVSVMPYWADGEAVEAAKVLAAEGWKDAQEPDGSHVRTLRMPLVEGGELFAGKERESLRRKLRQAEKAGATVRQAGADAIDPLHALHQALMSGQGKTSRPRAYFEAIHRAFVAPPSGRGAFFLAEHEGETLAALFVVRHGPLATFVLGASSSVDRPFSKMAPPMAAAARWARDQGCAVFDLGGIPDKGDDDPKRASIAQFKLDFAKSPVVLTREHARAIVPGLS